MARYRIAYINRPVAVNLYESKPIQWNSYHAQKFVDDYETIFESCGDGAVIKSGNEFLILFKCDRTIVDGVPVCYWGINLKFLNLLESA